MTKCVKCDGELASYDFNGIKFEICKKCGLVVISQEYFEKLSKNIDANCTVVDLFSLPSVTINEEVSECPHCNKQMEKVYYKGIVIDRCPDCKLLLFDNGELSKYYSKFSNFAMNVVNNAIFIKTYCSKEDSVQSDKKDTLNNTNTKTYNSAPIKIPNKVNEKVYGATDGVVMCFVLFLLAVAIGVMFLFALPAVSVILAISFFILLKGFVILKPQESRVLTLFGTYVGTLKEEGFHWVNPLTASYPVFGNISLKARTLDNPKQKVNDELGNPIEVGIMVTWEIYDTAKAVFNVDNYESFLSAQCDSALRRIVRQYPYDVPEDDTRISLRGDSEEISDKLKTEIQESVYNAGIHIIGARITHLAYSPEIAAAMLQRQQASAVLDAKKAIVQGAVGMVEMTLDRLSQNKDLVFDDATKAAMVNNLLVILCGNKESQPVIKSNL